MASFVHFHIARSSVPLALKVSSKANGTARKKALQLALRFGANNNDFGMGWIHGAISDALIHYCKRMRLNLFEFVERPVEFVLRNKTRVESALASK
jgi:hypothetical protein